MTLECSKIMTLMEQKRFMHILMGIGLGYQQFSQIQEKVGGVNNTTLSSRLDKMEEFGVIKRVVKQTKPLEIRYELTGFGEGLFSKLSKVLERASEWINTVEKDKKKYDLLQK